ncbi:MAG: hypothetical protein WEB88_01240, partial [Gemmatimonadota bacterium]
MRMRAGRACLVAAVLAAACGGDAVPAGDAAADAADAATPLTWRIGQKPLVSVGVASGEPAYELDGVHTAARLPDGGVALLDRRDPHVRVFDAAGRYEAGFAGDGGGPGELRAGDPRRSRSPLLLIVSGDTIRVGTGARLARYLRDGTYLGDDEHAAEPGQRLPWQPFGVRGHTVHPRAVTAYNAAIPAALASRPVPDSTLLLAYVRPASDGLLWVGPLLTDGAAPWDIVDARGRTVARVEVPVDFVVHSSGADWVAGVFRDSLDVEYVQVRALEAPLPAGTERLAAAAGGSVAAEIAPEVLEAHRAMASFLRNLVSRQELHYGDPRNEFRYASSLAELRFEAPEGFRFQMPAAHQTGWSGIIRHEATGAVCVMATGNALVPGVAPGV